MTSFDLLGCSKGERQHAFCALGLLVSGLFLIFIHPQIRHFEIVFSRHTFLTPLSVLLLGILISVSGGAYFIFRRPVAARHSFFDTSPWISAALIFTCAVFLLMWVNLDVLHKFMNSGDEHACYFLAQCLLKGRLSVELPPMAEFFQVTHVGMRDGKWFSVYPPGWPLLWAGGLLLGVGDAVNPVLAAAALCLFYLAGRQVFGGTSAWVSSLLIVTSPFFLFTGASYFSHSASLFMTAIFFYAFVRFERCRIEGARRALLWSLVAGFALGYGLLTRYLTTAALALPFLAGSFFQVLKERRVTRESTAGLFVVLFFAGLVLVHNFAVTGQWLTAPNTFDKPWERLGFKHDYLPWDGAWFFLARLFYLMDWTAPAIVFLYAAVLFWARSLDFLQRACSMAFLCLAAAYFFYFSWGGNQWGPRYYYEAYPFLVFTAVHGTVCFFDRYPRWRGALVALLLSGILVHLFQLHHHAVYTSEATKQRKALYALADQQLSEPSVVFVRGYLGDKLVLAQEDAVRNSPFLDGKVIYAHDKGEERNRKLAQQFSGRKFYLGTYVRSEQKANLLELNLK